MSEPYEYDPTLGPIIGAQPSIPMPMKARGWFGRWRYGCWPCKQEFRSEEDYGKHWIREHFDGGQE